MGFGSYDESEQKDEETNDLDDEDAVNVHETNHEGEVTFDSDADRDELLDKLQEIKD